MDKPNTMRRFSLIAISVLITHYILCQNKEPTDYFQDRNYSKDIGTSFFSPLDVPQNTRYLDPVIALGETIDFHFEVLGEDYQFLYAKLIHCDFDWQKSTLNEMDFLPSMNEFPIEDFYYSANTISLFTHYSITIPNVTKSGNYLLLIYDEDIDQIPLLSRRLVVYENTVSVAASVHTSNTVQNRTSYQRIVTEIIHDRLNILNPFNDLKIALLQNHNWQNAITDLLPTKSRIDQKYVSYDHFSGENEFPGGNEMRFLDITSTDYRGQRVAVIFKEENHIKARLEQDSKRSQQFFSGLITDQNGGFIIDNKNPGSNPEEADYVDVLFQLESEKLNSEVYVVGKFNYWIKSEENRMKYDSDRQMYLLVLRLKQGYYDYQYVTKTLNNSGLEGSFFETNNEYEVFVYYKDAFKNYDQVVGYSKILSGN